MGCSASKLDDEEAVRLCRDRRNFIREAVDQRLRFASTHFAYIKSLKRVSQALRNYVDGDEHYRGSVFSDCSMTPPFTPVKKLSPETVTIHVASYLRSGGEPSVAVEEWPAGSPETVRVESYYGMDHYGIDGFFASEASPMRSSPPGYWSPSPQTQQWDYFWNPFTSLDPNGYPSRDSLDRMGYVSRDSLDGDGDDDEVTRLRRVREEEGIPELEEEGNDDDDDEEEIEVVKDEIPKVEVANEGSNGEKEEALKENADKEKEHIIQEAQTQGAGSVEVSEARSAVELEVTNEQPSLDTPGFTVYLNRRPTSISEVMKNVECQFARICDTMQEVSVMLEVSRAQHSSTSSELAAIRMLNPVALFRSASSRSSSTRDLQTTSGSRDDGYASSTDYSEESCMISGSHQATLERLYAWEKKLYEEVKSGERIRIAYEKKCMLLRNHDVNGEEPSVVDRTRVAVRDLRTRLQVSIHAVQSVSKRIETLRDEELHPQLMELIQGLSRMWRTISDCHRTQKRTIDEAKLLLFSPSSSTPKPFEPTTPRPTKYAASLEAALRQWRTSLETWIDAQRSYATALANWITRCAHPQSETSARSPLSPGRTDVGAPPVYRICLLWSRLFEALNETRAVEGVEFFAAGIGSVCAQQREGVALPPEEKAAMPPERAAEVAAKVLCAGMAVAVGALAEFAGESAEGYEEQVRKCGEGGVAGTV